MEGVEELIKSLEKVFSEDKDDYAVFEGKKVKIASKNLHKINLVKSDLKIAFVDGGNAIISSASNFCLQFIRVYYCVFQNNKKILFDKKEFFCLTHAFSESGDVRYKTEFFGDDFLEPLEFSASDPTLKKGVNQCEISDIGSVARRFAELKLAKALSKGSDVIVIDGSLEPSVTGEKKYIDEIKNVVLCGLCKTNSLITEKGNSVSAVLMPKDFNYFKLDEKIYLVKLNKNSKHVFKLEVDKSELDLVLSLLIENSNDAVFPGYPYGLILVDKFARISNKEKGYIKTVLQSKTPKINDYTNSSDAHSVLDRIS